MFAGRILRDVLFFCFFISSARMLNVGSCHVWPTQTVSTLFAMLPLSCCCFCPLIAVVWSFIFLHSRPVIDLNKIGSSSWVNLTSSTHSSMSVGGSCLNLQSRSTKNAICSVFYQPFFCHDISCGWRGC